MLVVLGGSGCQSGKLLGGFWKSKADHPEMLASATASQSPEEHLAAGEREFQKHLQSPEQLGTARTHFESVVQKRPNDPVAHHRLAIIADLQKQYSVAEAHYRAALQATPENPELLHDAGYSLSLQGRTNEARPYFERALALSPQYADAAEKLADLHLRAGNREAASQVLSRTMPQPQVQETLARLSAPPAEPESPTLMGRIKNNLEHLRPGSKEKQPDLTQQVMAQVEAARRAEQERLAQEQRGQGIQQTAHQRAQVQPDPWGRMGDPRLSPDGISQPGMHASQLAEHIANIEREGQGHPGRPIMLDDHGNPSRPSGPSSQLDPWQNRVAPSGVDPNRSEMARSNGAIYLDGAPQDRSQSSTNSGTFGPVTQESLRQGVNPPSQGYYAPAPTASELARGSDDDRGRRLEAPPIAQQQYDSSTQPAGFGSVQEPQGVMPTERRVADNGQLRGGVQWPEASNEGVGGQPGMRPSYGSTGDGQLAEVFRHGGRGSQGSDGSRFAPRGQLPGIAGQAPTFAHLPPPRSGESNSGSSTIQPAGGLVPGGLSESGVQSKYGPASSNPTGSPAGPVTRSPYYEDRGTQSPASVRTSMQYNGSIGGTIAGQPYGEQPLGPQSLGSQAGVGTGSPAANEAYRAAAAAAMGTGPGQMFPVIKQTERMSPGGQSRINGGQFAEPGRYLPTDQTALETTPPPQWNGGSRFTQPNSLGQQLPGSGPGPNSPPGQYAPGSRFGTQSNYRPPQMPMAPANPLQSYDQQRSQYDTQYNAQVQQGQGTMPANYIPTPSAGLPIDRPTPASQLMDRGFQPDFPGADPQLLQRSTTHPHGMSQSQGQFGDSRGGYQQGYQQQYGNDIEQPEAYPSAPRDSSGMNQTANGNWGPHMSPNDPSTFRPSVQPQRNLPPVSYRADVDVPESYFNRSPATAPAAGNGYDRQPTRTADRPVIIPGA